MRNQLMIFRFWFAFASNYPSYVSSLTLSKSVKYILNLCELSKLKKQNKQKSNGLK